MNSPRRTLLSFLFLIGVGTTLEAQQAPPPERPAFDPAGQYELQISFGGQPTTVSLELVKDKDAWRGAGGNATIGMAAVSKLTQEGRKLLVTLQAEDGPAFVLTLTVKADNTVEGKWEGGGDGSAITGKKTK